MYFHYIESVWWFLGIWYGWVPSEYNILRLNFLEGFLKRPYRPADQAAKCILFLSQCMYVACSKKFSQGPMVRLPCSTQVDRYGTPKKTE